MRPPNAGGFVVLLLLGTLLTSTRARADAVPAAPDDCPRGALGVTSHAGVWCEASVCPPSGTCPPMYPEEGRTCQTQGLCVRSERYSPGGNRPADEPPTQLTRQVAVSACSAGETCADGSRCVVAQRCVKPSLVDAFDPKNAGCGCALVGARELSFGLGSALAGALALFAARRSSARSRRSPRSR